MLFEIIRKPLDSALIRIEKRMKVLIEAEKAREAKSSVSLHPTAVLHAEARIKNLSGDPGAIRVGAHAHINGELLVFQDGGSIQIGEWSHVGDGSCIWSNASVSIGNHVLISYLVSISDTDRQPGEAGDQGRVVSMTNGLEKRLLAKIASQPIVIEDDVWICSKATVFKGVRIGRGAIVTVGSVVAGDVPAWTMVAGSPAKVVRELNVG